MDQVVNEIEQKQRAERQQIRRDADLFEALTRHPAWPRYIALVEAIAQNYHAAVMKPIENVMEVTKPEFAKGVLNGLSLATAVPGMKIHEAREMRLGPDEG